MSRYQRAKRLYTWISLLAAVSFYGLLIVTMGISEWIGHG